MTKYHVHLYREMRLYYPNIDAESPAEAARIASEADSGEAEDIEDCNGENLGALVDVVGDTDFANSKLIDFRPQREKKEAAEMLSVLKAASEWIAAQLFVQRTDILARIRRVIAQVEGRIP